MCEMIHLFYITYPLVYRGREGGRKGGREGGREGEKIIVHICVPVV